MRRAESEEKRRSEGIAQCPKGDESRSKSVEGMVGERERDRERETAASGRRRVATHYIVNPRVSLSRHATASRRRDGQNLMIPPPLKLETRSCQGDRSVYDELGAQCAATGALLALP